MFKRSKNRTMRCAVGLLLMAVGVVLVWAAPAWLFRFVCGAGLIGLGWSILRRDG